MTVRTLPRTGVVIWDDPNGDDDVTREQFNATHQAIEDTSFIYSQDLLANRPPAAFPGRWFFATDTAAIDRDGLPIGGRAFYDDGVTWREIPIAAQPGDLRWTLANEPLAYVPGYGTIMEPGWLLCDGSPVLTAAYPALYAKIQTLVTKPDATHFIIPNLAARTLVASGVAGAGYTPRTIGDSGGEEKHLAVAAELPNHAHTANSHNHGLAGVIETGGGTGLAIPTVGSQSVHFQDPASFTPNIGGGGGSPQQAANNMPPYYVANLLIKF